MTLVGYQNLRSSALLSGQPRVENGQSAELNHVSSTSGSRWICLLWQASHSQASVRETVRWPLTAHYHAGIWWPHQSWREMHQSWTFSIQL